MVSRRVLGGATLGSLAVAAIAFAIVDQSTTIARSCQDSAAACAHRAVPGVAVAFVVVGIVALALALVPAIGWVVLTVRAGHAAEPGADTAGNPAQPAITDQAIEDHRRALSDDVG